MLARGLLAGLAVTWRNLTKRSVTAHYPDALPELPPRSRGVIALMEENCTVCMLCARECPAWCIYIDSHKESAPPGTEGGRERSHNMLDRFAIDYSLCMYCGICVDVCPFDALHWSPEFEYAEQDIRGLTHEKDRLQEWMWTVPPPPALDPAAAEPKEIASAEKAAARIAAAAQAELDANADPGQEAPRVRVRARELGADGQTGATAAGQPRASGGRSGATAHGRADPGADAPPDPSAGSQRGDRPSAGDL